MHEQWHAPGRTKPQDPLLRNWLLDTGSLTERLQSHCHQFEVEVLGQALSEISADEQGVLYRHFGRCVEPTQVREVFLKGNGAPWVFARSLLPSEFIQNEMRELETLGRQPLGKIIFNDGRFKRLDFQLLHCPPRCRTLVALGIDTPQACWGRRSLFQFESHHIMVAELFLPGSPAYANLQL